ncbi:hypothetical protein BH92_11145 [Rhodococcoides fascians A21d2]|uniref:hypothetical protein n=1 Tax=Rhodococcoides fascians TaxID=1828 RepID=UPI000AB7D475|nr:hypothetical protein [Rhodococcus fascians]QII00353.1 hypothetical protein BH92_11145 [Rhodococcus fascians A21d2]
MVTGFSMWPLRFHAARRQKMTPSVVLAMSETTLTDHADPPMQRIPPLLCPRAEDAS